MTISNRMLFWLFVIPFALSSVVAQADDVLPSYIEHSQSDYDKGIAKAIIEDGGFILFMRHAHREKWIDVTMYDAIEAIRGIKAENTYFKDAVCLSTRGFVQAKLMGEIVSQLAVPVGKIIASPSCRARQTAELVFGGYDEIDHRLMHYYGDPYGPFNQEHKTFVSDLKNFLRDVAPTKGKNTIVSAHNMMVTEKVLDGTYDSENAKIESSKFAYGMEEGGFFVLKIVDEKILYVAKFHTFQGFAKTFLTRPENN